MKHIQLTNDRVALVDDWDYDWLNQWRWYAKKDGYVYYVMRNEQLPNGKWKTVLMHRLILDPPEGIQIDHRDRNGLNNQQSNLRLCTHAENQRHQQLKCTNKTGFKGVYLVKSISQRPYRAQINVGNKLLHLGYYETAEAAARAYDKAAIRYYAAFALTNKELKLLERR